MTEPEKKCVLCDITEYDEEYDEDHESPMDFTSCSEPTCTNKMVCREGCSGWCDICKEMFCAECLRKCDECWEPICDSCMKDEDGSICSLCAEIQRRERREKRKKLHGIGSHKNISGLVKLLSTTNQIMSTTVVAAEDSQVIVPPLEATSDAVMPLEEKLATGYFSRDDKLQKDYFVMSRILGTSHAEPVAPVSDGVLENDPEAKEKEGDEETEEDDEEPAKKRKKLDDEESEYEPSESSDTEELEK